MALDPRVERGFGDSADLYEQSRPGWPAAAVERVLRELGVGASSTVVDLAAGTGKLTRELRPRVGRVVAVEPLPAMRRELLANVPDAEAVDGTAEAIPLADATADGLLVAEAFHWFATPEAVAEIARVVRPGGGIGLLWNLHDFGDEAWLEGMGTVLSQRLGPELTSANRHEPENWEHAFEGSPFTPFERFDERHAQRTDATGLIAHICTWSFVRALPEAERAELVAELDAVLRRDHPSPNDVVLPYRTRVHWARRR